jgi:hypothetical protein
MPRWKMRGSQAKKTAEKYVFEKSEGVRLTKIKPTIDASYLDKPAKRCSVCVYSKLLVDFAETASSKDKRRDACGACSAAKRARRFEGKELYHLELTPEKAWERAKVCSKCGVRIEIRDHIRGLSFSRVSLVPTTILTNLIGPRQPNS